MTNESCRLRKSERHVVECAYQFSSLILSSDGSKLLVEEATEPTTEADAEATAKDAKEKPETAKATEADAKTTTGTEDAEKVADFVAKYSGSDR